MNAKQLRDSILQYAMQGKLVSQLETDEPASKLIERIKAEKEQLIQQKVIKKEKALPSITESEIPFDIPDSWEWVRMGEIIHLISGRDLTTKEYGVDSTGVPYVTGASNFTNGKVEIVRWTHEPKVLSLKGDLLITCKGTIGEMAIQELEQAHIARQVMAIRILDKMNTKYVQLFLQSVVNDIKNSAKSMIPGISREDILGRLIPTPPHEEQIRIVEKVNGLSEALMKYEDRYEALTCLNRNFPKDLEKSILQYTMRGELVPQVASDEPASLLVERIKAVKERLVKEKFIKKEKALPPITEEEIPFDIPESWEWVRMGEIIHLISGRDLTTKEYGVDSTGVPYITGASNFNNGKLEIVRWTHEPKVLSLKGDLLITCKGTIGEMTIQELERAHIARQVMAIRILDKMNTEYIQLFLKSVVNDIKNAAKSMIPGISREDILERLVPIPPYEEQARIVKQLNAVKNQLDRFY